MSNFAGVQKGPRFKPQLSDGSGRVQKEAGEAELGVSGQVEHPNRDGSTQDLARQIVRVYRRSVAPNTNVETLSREERRALRDRIIAGMAGQGGSATHDAIHELASVLAGLTDELSQKAAGATLLKSSGESLTVFVPILRKDASRREVHGIIAQEEPDKAGEIFDYASSEPHFVKWASDAAERTAGAGQPTSYGNVRAQHSNVAAGKLTAINFDTKNKRIAVVAKIADDDAWRKVQEGVYTGFSIGGKYLRKWPDGRHMRYTAQPAEVSLVDSPCMPGATFTAVKSAPQTLAEVKAEVAAKFAEVTALLTAAIDRRQRASGFVTKVADNETVAQEELRKALDNGRRGPGNPFENEDPASKRIQRFQPLRTGEVAPGVSRFASGAEAEVIGTEVRKKSKFEPQVR